jgi:NADPH-dependent 2,4-dienoyl-CoA reductase/sulfur reductase-like enzyme
MSKAIPAFQNETALKQAPILVMKLIPSSNATICAPLRSIYLHRCQLRLLKWKIFIDFLKNCGIVLYSSTLSMHRVFVFSTFFSPRTSQTREDDMSERTIGSVMVVGGGIAGMQASLDLADAGYLVHLVEKSSAIGGVMSELDKTFPTNDCAM